LRDHRRSGWRCCLEWPHAVSGSPQWGDPINRPGDKAPCCCPGASSLKQVHVALRATWRVATHRHVRYKLNYANPFRLSIGSRELCQPRVGTQWCATVLTQSDNRDRLLLDGHQIRFDEQLDLIVSVVSRSMRGYRSRGRNPCPELRRILCLRTRSSPMGSESPAF
jgi:hypothetical protein